MSEKHELNIGTDLERLPRECTCAEQGPEKCEKYWFCCDCKREMMHRYGDLFGRCESCWVAIEMNL